MQYVLVYPEQQDVVLVGPAEGWRINDDGHAVGKTTGRPVIQLEDLLVALQTAWTGNAPVSCSIDPTEEGTRAMQALLENPKAVLARGGRGHPAESGAAANHDLGRLGNEPFRSGSGGRRLPHEADRHATGGVAASTSCPASSNCFPTAESS